MSDGFPQPMQVIAIAAMSVDGLITRHEQEGAGFASDADQQFFREALQKFDCCVFGARTFAASQAAILRSLTPARLRLVLTHSPERYAAHHYPEMLEFTDAAPEELLENLRQRGKTRCAVLGGGEIYTLFLANALVDELWLTLEPRLFGQGTRLTAGLLDCALTLQECRRLAEHTLLLTYRVRNEVSSGLAL